MEDTKYDIAYDSGTCEIKMTVPKMIKMSLIAAIVIEDWKKRNASNNVARGIGKSVYNEKAHRTAYLKSIGDVK